MAEMIFLVNAEAESLAFERAIREVEEAYYAGVSGGSSARCAEPRTPKGGGKA